MLGLKDRLSREHFHVYISTLLQMKQCIVANPCSNTHLPLNLDSILCISDKHPLYIRQASSVYQTSILCISDKHPLYIRQAILCISDKQSSVYQTSNPLYIRQASSVYQTRTFLNGSTTVYVRVTIYPKYVVPYFPHHVSLDNDCQH